MTALSATEMRRVLAEDAPDMPVRVRPLKAFVLARFHAWEGVDNLQVSRHLLYMQWLVKTDRLVGDTASEARR